MTAVSITGYVRRNADRFRIVVAMWVVVGFGGALLFGSFGLMLVTGTGMFADKAVVDPGLEFSPGEEVAVDDGVGPGNFMVLATPATVDAGTVECAWKSRVYSTGEQREGLLDIARPDGVAETLTAYGLDAAQLRPPGRDPGHRVDGAEPPDLHRGGCRGLRDHAPRTGS